MHHRENNYHTTRMNWPAIQETRKLDVIAEIHRGMILSVWTMTLQRFVILWRVWPTLFHQNSAMFYERPGFCWSMLHGEYATKIKSDRPQYNNVHTVRQNNTNNQTVSLHSDVMTKCNVLLTAGQKEMSAVSRFLTNVTNTKKQGFKQLHDTTGDSRHTSTHEFIPK